MGQMMWFTGKYLPDEALGIVKSNSRHSHKLTQSQESIDWTLVPKICKQKLLVFKR